MSQAQLKKATEIAESWQLGKDINGNWHVVDPSQPVIFEPRQTKMIVKSFCGQNLWDLFRAMDKVQATNHGKPICTCVMCANLTLAYTMKKLQEA